MDPSSRNPVEGIRLKDLIFHAFDLPGPLVHHYEA